MSEVKETLLKDYRVPDFLVDKTELQFDLQDDCTYVKSRLHLRRNPQSDNTSAPLFLHGEQLELVSLALDNKLLDESRYRLDEEGLVIEDVPDSFVLACENIIHPDKNTELEGLYLSNGMYCTQCEAEGFRKITYYPDRPDVMSEFETTIIADNDRFNTMLSNGNCISDETEGSKRIVRWHDPFKKPAYLFALVAGNLACLSDTFVTCSGREVLLEIYAEQKDLDKCDFAMQSLKKAMRWDEETYGREYDLDRFMVVAVDHFNMGAMENKGLNIFNTSCVLAHPSTTTDAGFQRVEAVVAHEYFHNWSGNRVTCRDWFQLSLKEGFTVFRDSQFSADMNSAAVKRIEDVSFLRSMQFVEDAGPMAHPVRPQSYMEIGNFYTLTIYEKGAEVVRMLAQLLGPQQFRKASDLYFERHDGEAVTCEDFVRCMEEVSGRDLGQFRRWYEQAGTPELHISDSWDAENKSYTLTVEQRTPPTPGQSEKLPVHIPLKMALYNRQGSVPLVLDGKDIGRETVLDITAAKQSFVFEQLEEPPLPSLLRDFSAPVKVFYDYSPQQLSQLIVLDNDGFCRWDAMQSLYLMVLQAMIDGGQGDAASILRETLEQLLAGDGESDPALLALMLDLPTENYLAEFYSPADPDAIARACKQLSLDIAGWLEPQMASLYQSLADDSRGLSAKAMAARRLRNKALACLMLLDNADYRGLCRQQFENADNMTDQLTALRALVHAEHAEAEAQQALAVFYQLWQDETLVVNMWLQVQASSPQADALAVVKSLLQHETYDAGNPNKVRSLVGAFCHQNFAGFHQSNASGYRFLADQVLQLDKRNPQIAARLLGPLTHWHKFESGRSEQMKQILADMQSQDLSKDVYEVVSKSLAN